MKQKIQIFTDGASKGNPGRGGYGGVISRNGTVTEVGGFKELTTNNEMELRAVIEALKVIQDSDAVCEIYTDSKYVVQGSTGWIFGWLKNGWKTRAEKDVLNKELWQELLPYLKKVKIEWNRVPGHVGIIGNERADTIASDFAANGTFDLYSGTKEGYAFDLSDTSYDKEKAAARSASKKRSAMKAYSYVSKVDGEIQTHKTWGECESRVKGKKGTRFKKSLDAGNEKEIIKDFGG